MRKDKKAKVEDIQATDNLQIDDIQVNEDAGVIQKPKAGEVLKKFFRSLFVSENGNEAKFLTLYKKEGTKSILSSLLYSFKALGGRQDIAQLETIALSGILKAIYIYVNYIKILK